MNKTLLTEEQAYLAMYSFLAEYYKLTKFDEIGSLLGSMSILEDGGTADPAIRSDWSDAVSKALNGQVNPYLDLDN